MNNTFLSVMNQEGEVVYLSNISLVDIGQHESLIANMQQAVPEGNSVHIFSQPSEVQVALYKYTLFQSNKEGFSDELVQFIKYGKSLSIANYGKRFKEIELHIQKLVKDAMWSENASKTEYITNMGNGAKYKETNLAKDAVEYGKSKAFEDVKEWLYLLHEAIIQPL